ncbi:Ig-like domain-containing protein, partial [Clostridium beijerinckii]
MEQKRILSWVVVVVMIFTILLPTKKVYALSSYVIGGQTSNGSLKVTIDGTGEIYVEKYNGSDFQQQYYAPSGAVLNVDGQLYTIGGYYTADNGGNINSILAAVKTQTADSNSVTTVWDAGLIEVTQKVTLPSLNSQYIKLDWSFNNISGSLINNIHFLRGEDTYLNGGDNGAGFWDAPTHTIGVTKTDNGVTQRLGMQGITTPNSYTSQEYDIVANEVCGGETLSNTIDDNVNTDNGYALEWNTSSLAANSTWKVSAIESFIASSITASADNGITVGGPVTLTFNVTNSSNNSQDVTYSISNIDGWSVQLQKESDTIASHATNSLSAVVTPSGSINNGVYEIQLNISSGGVETQAIGTVTVNITQAVINSVSVSPETASVVQGQTKQLESTVNAVGGAAETVTWSSSDASGKVTVDETGLVTVASDAAPGDYIITATSTFDTSKKGTATITVTAAPVAPAVNSVAVDPTTASIVQGENKQLTKTVIAVGGAAETVTWSSSDASGKVTVD